MTTPDRPDLDALGKLCDGWRGSFNVAIGEDGAESIAFLPTKCDEGRCECAGLGLPGCGDELGSIDGGADAATEMLNALPALIAYARRVEGERDALTVERDLARDEQAYWNRIAQENRAQYLTVADAIAPSSNNAHELADRVRAFRKRAEALEAELTAERDAHHATCDALARERAERVGRAEFDALRAEADRLRDIIEAMNPEHNYMALLDLYMERARDAEAEVARLRGLLPTVVRKLEYLLRDYPGDKETAGLIESIRKEAAGE